MNPEDMEVVLTDLERHAGELESRAATLGIQTQVAEAEARDARETADGVRRQIQRMRGDVVTERTQPALLPRPQREPGVLACMPHDGSPMSFAELHAEFRRRGWLNPGLKNEVAALRAVVYRLCESGKLTLGPNRGEFHLALHLVQPVRGHSEDTTTIQARSEGQSG